MTTDAERWAYVRDCLAQTHGMKMDGEYPWRFRALYTRGPTVTEAVDRAIKDMRERETDGET